MKITDLSPYLFDELGSTKERLKYVSITPLMTYNDPKLQQSYNLVTHEQLDTLVSNTKDLVLDIIKQWLDEEDTVKYFSTIKRVVNDRIERDFP